MEVMGLYKAIGGSLKYNLDPLHFPAKQSVESQARRCIFQGKPVILRLKQIDAQEQHIILDVSCVLSHEWEGIEGIHKVLQEDTWWVWQILPSSSPLEGFWSDGSPIQYLNT